MQKWRKIFALCNLHMFLDIMELRVRKQKLKFRQNCFVKVVSNKKKIKKKIKFEKYI